MSSLPASLPRLAAIGAIVTAMLALIAASTLAATESPGQYPTFSLMQAEKMA
jgi:hypothetical protein